MQLPWHGRPSCSITMCPSSAAAPSAPRYGTPVEDQPAADAGAERQHDHVARPLAPRRHATRRSRRRSRRCRSPHGKPNRSPINVRSGTSVSGMFTEETAVPDAWSIVDGTPSPIAATSSETSPSIVVADRVDDLFFRRDRRRHLAERLDLAGPVDQPGGDLGAAEVDADDAVCPHERAATITAPMAQGDKPYRVYRGGRTKGRVPLQRRVEQTPRRDGGRPDRPVTPAPSRAVGPTPPALAPPRRDRGRRPPAPGARLGASRATSRSRARSTARTSASVRSRSTSRAGC